MKQRILCTEEGYHALEEQRLFIALRIFKALTKKIQYQDSALEGLRLLYKISLEHANFSVAQSVCQMLIRYPQCKEEALAALSLVCKVALENENFSGAQNPCQILLQYPQYQDKALNDLYLAYQFALQHRNQNVTLKVSKALLKCPEHDDRMLDELRQVYSNAANHGIIEFERALFYAQSLLYSIHFYYKKEALKYLPLVYEAANIKDFTDLNIALFASELLLKNPLYKGVALKCLRDTCKAAIKKGLDDLDVALDAFQLLLDYPQHRAIALHGISRVCETANEKGVDELDVALDALRLLLPYSQYKYNAFVCKNLLKVTEIALESKDLDALIEASTIFLEVSSSSEGYGVKTLKSLLSEVYRVASESHELRVAFWALELLVRKDGDNKQSLTLPLRLAIFTIGKGANQYEDVQLATEICNLVDHDCPLGTDPYAEAFSVLDEWFRAIGTNDTLQVI